MTAVVDVVVNGAPRRLPSGTTVADVVSELAGAPAGAGIAVALDGAVVSRGAWTTPLAPGSRIEVLTATQGG